MIITRRSFIAGAAALAAAGHTRLLAEGRKIRVGIVGGGIIGASTAVQLARAGAEVIVFEKEEPAAGATGASVAWINPVVNDAHYMKLRVESIDAWQEDDMLYGMGAIWGGSISWVNGEGKHRASASWARAMFSRK